MIHLIATYGLPALLVLMILDSCGVPLPSEVIMPVGGALAAAGHLNVAVAGTAVVLMLAAWYVVGRRGS